MLDGTKPVQYSFFKTFIVSYRWFFNVIIVFIPWVYFSLGMVLYNFAINVFENNFWADGNLWLLGNTIFMIVLSIHTWFLMLEWPFYLRHTFGLRWVWIIIGIIYSAQIVSDAFAVLGMDEWRTDDVYEKYTLVDMFMNMFLAYNVLLHWPVVPITVAMIGKEVEMTIYQLVTTNGPAEYQLSWANS
jgi:hypothetical protein